MQNDIVITGLAFVGGYYLLRCIAILVLRLAGKRLNIGQHVALSAAMAFVVLAVGAVYLGTGQNDKKDHLVDAPRIVRDSILWDDEQKLLDSPVDPFFEFETALKLPAEQTGITAADHVATGRLPDLLEPFPGAQFQPDHTIGEQDFALDHIELFSRSVAKRERGVQVSASADSADTMLWNAGSGGLEGNLMLPFDFEAAQQDELATARFGSAENHEWALGSRFLNKPSDGDENATLEILAAWAKKNGDFLNLSNAAPILTDDPNAPRRQIEDLMRASPGFYNRIPEVRRFIGNQPEN